MKNLLVFSFKYGDLTEDPYSLDAKKIVSYIINNYDVNVDVVTIKYEDKFPKLAKERVFEISKTYFRYKKIDAKRETLINNLNSESIFKKNLSKFLLKYYYNKKFFKILNLLDSNDLGKGKYFNFKITDKELKSLNKIKTKYDALLWYATPFNKFSLVKQIKEMLGIKDLYVYTLDPYVDSVYSKPDEIDERLQLETEVYTCASKIFIPKEIYDRANLSPVKSFNNKVVFIPNVVIEDNSKYRCVEKKEVVNFVYSGIFYTDIRNPKNLLELFLKLPSNYHLHLYYRDCENIINKYKEKLGDRLHVNGFIYDQEEYKKVIGKADFLINLGNIVDNQIPSKMFAYVSFGVPVIHFTNNPKDYTNDLFKNYPIFATFDYNNCPINKLIEYVKNHLGKSIDYSEISKCFNEYTIENVVKKLLK